MLFANNYAIPKTEAETALVGGKIFVYGNFRRSSASPEKCKFGK